jgi:hypothetical protein
VQYFVRTIEKHKQSKKAFSTELLCSSLGHATQAARQQVRDSNPSMMLQADACFKNRGAVRTKYCCWIDEGGDFHEHSL